MIANPLVLPVSGVTPDLSLNFVGQGRKPMSSVYRATNGLWMFDIEHALSGSKSGSRVHSEIHLESRKAKEDNPLDYHSMHIRLILDRPESLDAVYGFTEAEVDKAIGRLAAFVGTSANITKLLGLQS